MAAKYDFKTSPDIQGEKEQPTLYPQIVVSGTKKLKDLAKDIARRSTVHEGTVVGLLCDLESIIANYLADGYNVKLGEPKESWNGRNMVSGPPPPDIQQKNALYG